MPATTKTQADAERSATLQERSREFTGLYERNAYLAYNLTLRIACEPQAAREAVETAFLSVAGAENAEGRLVPALIKSALASAPRHPSPQGAGTAEAQELLEAIATLRPTERAAVAAPYMNAGGLEQVASTTAQAPDQVAMHAERGEQRLAAKLDISGPELRQRLRDWPWSEPPPDLWERVYASFYAGAQRRLNGGEPPDSGSVGERNGKRPPEGRSRRSGLLARLRSTRWSVRLAALAAAGIVGGIVAIAAAGGNGSGADTVGFDAPAPEVPAPPASGIDGESADASGAGGGEGKPYEPLSAEELDELRLAELKDLRAYAERQNDSALTSSVVAELRERLAEAQAEVNDKKGGRGGDGGGRGSGGGGASAGGGGAGGGGQSASSGGGSNAGAQTGGGSSAGSQTGDGGGSQPNDGDASGDPDGDGGKGNGKGDGKGGDADKSDCLFEEESGSYICPQ